MAAETALRPTRAVMVGGLVAGVVVLIVGSRMGQNRLWTRHILKRNRRRRR